MKVKKGLGLNQCKMKRKKGNKGWMYERMNAWKDKWKEERKEVCMNEWIKEWKEERKEV